MAKFVLFVFISLISSIGVIRADQKEVSNNISFSQAQESDSKPTIYVFYNNDICYSCPQSVDLIESIFNRYYKDSANLKLINYIVHDDINYEEKYDLHQPLEIVLETKQYYIKHLNIQERIIEPVSFTEFFQEKVDQFLNDQK